MSDGDNGSNKRPSRPPPRVGSARPPPRVGSTRPLGRPSSSAPPPRPGSSRPPPPATNLQVAAINYDLVNAARRILGNALAVVKGERVVIFVDRARVELGTVLEEVTRHLGAEPHVFLLEELGPRPVRAVPEEARLRLAEAQASVMICGYEEGEHPMRLEVISIAKASGLRHAHMVGISARSLIPGFSVDPSRILDATRSLRMRMRDDSTFKVRSALGTDLLVRLDRRHRWMEHVGVVRPGRWENFPSGKLTTCPLEVTGTFVADASVGERFGALAGLLTRTPVHVRIEDSIVRGVRCDDRPLQREIQTYIATDSQGARIGAVHLGTNVGLLSPVGELICDLNLPGLHLGCGMTFHEQTGAGWTSRVQLGLTAGALDVDLDGAPLLRSGRYLVT